MTVSEKPNSQIGEIARKTTAALRAILDLDDNEDPRWHGHVQDCRQSLKELARSPSLTTNDLLEKARVLSLITTCDHLHDHRYELAQSILDDLKSFGKG